MSRTQRTARIEDSIWDAAQARAQAAGPTLATLKRAAVQRYATGELTSPSKAAGVRPGDRLAL